MTIKVEKMLIPISKYPIKSPYIMVPETLTVHNTYNDASAINEVKYMTNNSNQVSFHVAIDDLKVIQAVPFDRTAWHAGDGWIGDGNRKSIGIEICYSKSGGERYKKAEALAIKYIAQVLHERKWGVDRVRTHKSWNEIGIKKGYSKYVKNCPHRILNENRWHSFLNAINNELKVLNKVVKTPVATTPTKPSVPMWDNMVIRESQIGRVTILKPINLWKRENDGSLTMIRVLKVGDVFRVYDFDDKNHGGQYDLGSNCWLTNMTGYVKYETPSKSKKVEADKFYNR